MKKIFLLWFLYFITVLVWSDDCTIELWSDGCSKAESVICNTNQELQIRAIPSQYQHFVQWADGNTDNPRTVLALGDDGYIAEFEPDTIATIYVLSAECGEEEQIICNTNQELQIRAFPSQYQHFVQWSDGNTDNPRTIVATDGDSYIAEFEPDTTIFISVAAANCKKDEQIMCNTNQAIQLQAIPSKHYHFSQWSDGNTDNPRAIVAADGDSYTAEFKMDTFVVSIPDSNNVVIGGGTYDYGSSVTLTVDTSACVHFLRWSDGNTDNPRTIVIKQDTSMYPILEIDSNIYHTSIQTADISMGKVKLHRAPSVVLDAVSLLSDSSALCQAYISNDWGNMVAKRGFCYGTTSNLTIETGMIMLDTTDLTRDSFSCTITNLLDETIYYICAFATNDVGTSYSPIRTVTTYAISPNCQACSLGTMGEMVDLGLSVCWADHNVGASSPEDYGCYFAWGETGVKDEYSSNTYSFKNGSKMTKYNSSDKKQTLDEQDDAAIVNWGKKWRMPTRKELTELTTKCIWTKATRNSINGYNIQGPNGKSIFLPLTGYYSSSTLSNADSLARYWSSDLFSTTLSSYARSFHIGTDTQYISMSNRYSGYSIRPVVNSPKLGSRVIVTNDSSITYIGKFLSIGGGDLLEFGICYDTLPNPSYSISPKILASEIVEDSFICHITSLLPNKTYYISAFATNSLGTGYSETKSFTTPNCYKCKTGTVGTAVDLGLPSGTKWADHNIGASSPEDYGSYFAWGETGVKLGYSWANYSLSNGSITTMTKYSTSSYYGTVDNKTTLEPSDDAATVNWDSNWRMPTKDEMDELDTICTWTWTQKNGINGYDVKGPNGNSIFLPAAGYRNDISTGGIGSYGDYWSSSLCASSAGTALKLSFGSSTQNMSCGIRSLGSPVRPVCK